MKQLPFSLNLPTAIVAAAVMISGAILFDRSSGQADELGATAAGSVYQEAPQDEITDRFNQAQLVTPVEETDHVRGLIDAPITIIEYSDFDCPFCQRFHETMIKIVADHPSVRWVYRHFPLDSIHPYARLKAQVSECVAMFVGPEAFWDFTDQQLDNVGGSLDLAAVAKQFSIAQSDLESCSTNGQVVEMVQADQDNAVATGGKGTPWSLIVLPSGEVLPLNGAQPYQVISAIVQAIEEREL